MCASLRLGHPIMSSLGPPMSSWTTSSLGSSSSSSYVLTPCLVMLLVSFQAGVQGLALSAAATYAPKNIRVNCVAPGLVRTPLRAPPLCLSPMICLLVPSLCM